MKYKGKNIKALVLFSGGLDSILTVKILEKQGIKVTAITFESFFFDSLEAKKSALENKIAIRTENISKVHFGIVKKPRHGHGVGMNPCIDCHLLMLKTAKQIMRKDGYNFPASGEVLGQRPMSQNAGALKLIEREAGLVGKILRPLSAGVLPETEIEKKGLVDRKKLYAISGRSRKEQMALAKHFQIKYYPTPAGGCILTDKEYSKKLRELLQKIEKPRPSDFQLLRIGRHFWDGENRVIIGRNHEENLKLKKIAEKSDILLELKGIPGPLSLVRGKNNESALALAKNKIIKYAKKLASQNPNFIATEIKE
jgi:tRNA-uridine 2-sulfurtransferase